MIDRYGFPILVATLIAAMAMRIMPLPHHLMAYVPDWVLLAAIYWLTFTPEKFGVGAAWVTGVFTDALTGQVLGQHALAYAAVAYLCLQTHRRFQHFPLPQQALLVLALLLMSRLLIHWSQSFIDPQPVGVLYWVSPFIGALAWPVCFGLLRNFGSRYTLHS